MKLTADILGVLRTGRAEGNLLYFPGRVDSGLYEQLDAALAAAGGRWDTVKQAHVFDGQAAIAVAGLCALADVPTAKERKQATQFFPTPPEVVERLITRAALGPGQEMLEPSAGTGAIAAATAPFVAAVDCIELAEGNAAEIRAAGYARTVTTADFLAVPPSPGYDRVIMNPPFAGGNDVRHVRHALGFVRPGGRLVAVMSPGVQWHGSQAARALRDQVETWGGWFEEVEAGAFAASGTPVETVIAVIPVPGGPVTREVIPGGGEAVRVTTDWSAWGAPLFIAAVAEPGVYVHATGWNTGRVFRFAGNCIGCGAKTWAHDDGDEDVRGAFGPNTCDWLFRSEFPEDSGVPANVAFPRCWACHDDAARHQTAVARALAALAAAGEEPPPPQAPEPGEHGVQLAFFGTEAA